jgi:peroxiredoxin
MRIIQLFFALFFAYALYAQKTNDPGFVLNGSFTGIADGTEVKLEDPNKNNELIASGKFQRGKFSLKGKLAEPSLLWLKITGEGQQYIYMENKTVSASGNKPVAQNFKVTGSQSHEEFLVFQNMFNPLVVKLQPLVTSINSSPYGPVRDSMMNEYNAILSAIQKNTDEFVSNNKSSFITPFVLFVTAQYNEDVMLMEKRYLQLDEAVKSIPMGVSLKNYIDYNKVGAVGTQAIDFTQPDTSGIPVSLSSFKGKYVLVDFWASWCGPCRMENPNVVASFNKFKEKNFTVLGVSLDRPGRKEDWINAIYKDNLTWTHVSDLQFWNNAAAQLYRVSGIPYNLLLDPSGKIIGKNLRGTDLDSKLCEVLGCN